VAPERRRPHQRAVDCAWLLGTAVLLALFIYLQGLV
jgi:cobalt/nickel transport system permease protein